jgi:hypothetical protein
MPIHARTWTFHPGFPLTKPKHIALYIVVCWRSQSHCNVSLYHSHSVRSLLTHEELSQTCFPLCLQLFLSGRNVHWNQASTALGRNLLHGLPSLDDAALSLLFVPPWAFDWGPDVLVGVNDMSTLELVQLWQAHDCGCVLGG